jgi:hypothetical protein
MIFGNECVVFFVDYGGENWHASQLFSLLNINAIKMKKREQL